MRFKPVEKWKEGEGLIREERVGEDEKKGKKVRAQKEGEPF